LQHRHIILIEAGRRQIYDVAAPRELIRMLDFFLYLLYRTGLAVVSALPLRVLFVLGNIAGFIAWLVAAKYRRLASHNLQIVFGREKSARELRRIARRHFQRLSANLLGSFKLAAMPPEKIEKCVETENFDVVDRHLRAGRPVVLVVSHLGNWESFAQTMPRFAGYARISTIYQKLENRFLNEHVRKSRSRTGLETFDRAEGFAKPIALLRSGGLVGMLGDQHAGDQGLWVPFFGRLASTTPLPALLAKRTNAVLIAAAVYANRGRNWRMIIEPALETKEESVESLTAKTNEIIARQIRRSPEDWFWVHARWKTPRPNFLLARYKRGVYLPAGISAKDLQPFRILIRASNWLGDSVISVPAVRAIKAGRPDAHITIAAPEKIAAIWKLVPEVDEIIPLPAKRLFASARLLRRQPRFDVAVLFPNSLRVALEALLARIPRRVGYRGHSRGWLLNQVVPTRSTIGRPQHQALHYLHIAESLGAEINDVDLSFSQKTSNAQLRKLSRAGGLTPNVQLRNSHQTLIGLAPGAEYGPAKRWLPERFAETAKKISEQHGVQWILFGTKKDVAIGAEICKVLGDRCTNRIGQTSIEQLIEELRPCRVLLTNDTGTMHLASLLGVPVVAIFGSTEPRLTGPLGDNHIVLRQQVECSPCFLRECPIDFRCMKAVSVEEVRDAVLSILNRTSH
jgi:lipopolysaccharide heptosyltransferase II